ncbi:2-oxo acid dehydrogenase subunit E2 [Nocardia sp. NPDC058705]|uniref:2-oxo acid dehydrogenase subunit E2 n=1 Tax=Nocardia sp. NPDC058705 TaxID=3346609 RepID=UPI00367C5FC7
MPDIVMPRLSDTMEDGVVSVWLKKVGDQITRGEIVAEIETDKALMELEAYEDGILESILAEPGVRVAIGEPIATVGDGTGSVAAPADSTSAAPTPTVVASAVVVATAPAAAPLPGSRTGLRRTGVVKSSPLARKIARELQVDIGAVVGTGPDGRITKRDVEAAHSAEPAVSADIATPSRDTSVPAVRQVSSSGEYEEVALTNIQRLSATRLTESMQQAPHFYVTSAIDVTDLFAFRAQINATLDLGKVSVNDLLVKAVAVALRKDGSINVSFAGDKLLRHKQTRAARSSTASSAPSTDREDQEATS